ncbi:MAG: hypothetical protein E7329_07975 [Clostridiales bacterium]|nr:hypothetical protein [Clostridiales bacterium]
MGTWGTGIYQNDVADDVKTLYMAELRSGKSSQEAYEYVVNVLGEIMDDPDEAPDFWFAMADTMWNCGCLTDEVKEKALMYLDRNDDLERWHAAGQKAAKNREKALSDLREKLLSPMPAPRIYRKPNLYICPWQIGDVFLYPLDSDIARSMGFGEYSLLFQKVGTTIWHPGHVIPVVRVKIARNDLIPQNTEEFDQLPYLKTTSPCIYQMELINSSKRVVPQKLKYWGHTENIPSIPGEYLPPDDPNLYCHLGFLWKWFDEGILKWLTAKNDHLKLLCK